jgi:hypothetical protein
MTKTEERDVVASKGQQNKRKENKSVLHIVQDQSHVDSRITRLQIDALIKTSKSMSLLSVDTHAIRGQASLSQHSQGYGMWGKWAWSKRPNSWL